MFKFIILAIVIASTTAQYHHGHQLVQAVQDGHHEEHYAPAHYEFKYGVEDPHTGDKHSQSEHREGDVVKGEYSLVEPDGTIRKVEYTADKHNGFNAVVTRTGHANHPAHHAAPAIHHSAPIVSTLGGHGAASFSNGGLHGFSGHY